MLVSFDMLLEEARHGDGVFSYVMQRARGRVIDGVEPLTTSRGHNDHTLYVGDARALEAELPIDACHVIIATEPRVGAWSTIPQSLAFVRNNTYPELLVALMCALARLSAWDARMLEAIAARQDTDALLHIAAEKLDNPLALFDDRLALLGWAGDMPPESADTIWADVLLAGYSPAEFYTSDELRRIEREMQATTWPLVITPKRDQRHQNLTQAIRMDGRQVGSLGQVDVCGPFTAGQVGLVDLVRERLELAFAQRLSGSAHEDGAAYLLRLALNSGKVDEVLASYHLQKLRGTDASEHRLLCCPLPENGSDTLAESLTARLGGVLRHAITLCFEQTIVSLVPADLPLPERYAGTLAKLGLCCIASEPFGSMSQARYAFQQCSLVAKAGAGVPGSVVSLPEVFESVLPTLLARDVPVEALCARKVLQLVTSGYQGDVARGSELAHELYVYLMNGCNARLTAKQLFLHRNTFAYHMEQLEGILGERFVDMSHARRLHLAVSCLLAESAQA